MNNSTKELINQAIQQKLKLVVNYDSRGGVRSNVLLPLRWTNSGELCAFSFENNGEIYINPAVINKCDVYDGISREVEISSYKKASQPSQSPQSNQKPKIQDTELPALSEEQNNSADYPVSSPRLSRKKEIREDLVAGIEEIKTHEDWHHLLDFYRECIIHENRQDFVIETSRNQFLFFDAQPDQLEAFLNGQSYLSFHEEKNRNIYKFVTSIQKKNNQQLYVGYPIFVADSSRLAPVLIAPITTREDNNQVILEAEEYEVSYAALASLGLRDEEILSVITSISESLAQKAQLSIQSMVEMVIQMTGELLGEDLNRLISNTRSLTPNTFEYRPCLFWASPGSFTASLIKELDALGTYWSSAPDSLKSLLTVVPEHAYPEAAIESKDRNIFVAPVYDRQRQAITASLSEPVTVVTGPPGTGKSQFILNLIVQSVLRGERVLFASRNNKAVDVVMDRLQGEEIKFPGAIRTGNKDQRRRATDQISARLRELSSPSQNPDDMDALQERYWQFHQRYLEKLDLLKKIRSKSSLLVSRTTEMNDLRKLIPSGTLSVTEKLAFSFGTDEYEYLQSFLSKQRMEGLELKSRQESLAKEIIRRLSQDSEELPFVAFLRSYEDQWGSMGDDLLQPKDIDSIKKIQDFLDLWLVFLDALEQQIILNALSATHREQKADLEKKETNLSANELVEVRYLAEKIRLDDILILRKKSKEYLGESRKLQKQRGNIWFRLLTWLGIRNPIRNLAKRLTELQLNFQNPVSIPETPGWQNLEGLHKSALSFVNILVTAYATIQVNHTREKLADVRTGLETATGKLPKLIVEKIKKLNPSQQAIATTRQGFNQFVEEVSELSKLAEGLRLQIQNKLDNNSDELEILQSLRNTEMVYPFDLWVKLLAAEPDSLVSFLSNWRNVLSFWKTLDVIKALKDELQITPTEDVVAPEARELGDSLFKLGAKMLTAQWKINAWRQVSSTFQQAEQYVSAVRQLLEKDSSPNYSQLKRAEEEFLPAIMKLFPVWATTNLSAKSNFPLSSGLFDLVIIDEASQCDLPSALPLLYRAGRVVIVGDAMQLRHVARIIPKTEQEASQKHGVSLIKFSYSQFSLFDIARRSVHSNPSTILLNEHYRSDPQIFGFSKEEFYSEELKIYTDISIFSLPPDYVKDGTGVFWIDTPGMTQHPSGGSAYNDSELKTISELIPKLLGYFKRRKMNKIKLGVITPYREQEKRILNWLESFQGSNANIQNHITVGTAHKFQGDERDVVIFSPVISQRIKENSRKWLDDTSNLLNVAISRARVTMIVVGDWKYCLSLDKNSKYHKLAEYIARHPNRVVNTIDALPLFKGLPLDIIGVLLDRHNRDRNRLTLQKLLLACDQFVWWMDPFISSGIFDLFMDIAKHPEFKLKDIRILTSQEQTQDERNPINPKLVKNIRKEFARNGGSIQLGLLPKREMPHDRYYYSVGYAINMPPFSGAYGYGNHTMVSEYTESKTKAEFFETYWSKAEKY